MSKYTEQLVERIRLHIPTVLVNVADILRKALLGSYVTALLVEEQQIVTKGISVADSRSDSAITRQ